MQNEKCNIEFTVIYGEKPYRIRAVNQEYDSLMSLIAARFALSGFGICSGAGTCGTCGIRLTAPGSSGKFVLSCERQVDEKLSDKIIIL
jgi:hypothetical protein